MKKVIIIFVILLVLFIGILIGGETGMGRAQLIQENAEQFENEIIIPGNDYQNNDNVIVPGTTNKVAKTGGNVIKGIFNITFDILKKISN